MRACDIILPHRLFINRSLRKASEELRFRLDNYQLEYNREIERCEAEINQAKDDKDKDFEKVKLSLNIELSKDKTFFDTVQEGLLEYADLYFQHQSLTKIQEIKVLEKQTFVEYGDFLTEQMKLLGEEIDILEVRKDKLILQAKVEDVIELIGLSGCDLSIGDSDEAPVILEKVSRLIDECDDDERPKKLALISLRTILQERVDFLPIIRYISWIIEQKKQFRRQLSSERRKTNDNKKDKATEILQIRTNLDAVKFSLMEQARVVRDFWEIPIYQLNVQISSKHKQKKELIDLVKIKKSKLDRIFYEIDEIKEQLQRMRNARSDDSDKWDRLQREKESYKDDISPAKGDVDKVQGQISQIKSDIEALKSEQEQWFDRLLMIYKLYRNNRVALISKNMSQELDECEVINERLAELNQYVESMNRAIELRSKLETEGIQQRKKEKEGEFKDLIVAAEKSQTVKNNNLEQANNQLLSSKKRDKRFFVSKWFSDSEEVVSAKRALLEAESKKKSADVYVLELKKKFTSAMSNFDNQIVTSRPQPYIPSKTENEEMLLLKSRKTELMGFLIHKKIRNNNRKEGRHDSSN